MEFEVFKNVRDRVVSAEGEYVQSNRDTKGIRAVVKAIEKMRGIRNSLANDGESTEDIERLIETSERKFANALNAKEDCTSPSQAVLDFKEWAHELQCALKLHDPLLFSLEFSDDESGNDRKEEIDAPKSWAGISSAKIVKMAPLGKKTDDTFTNFEGLSKKKAKQFRSMAICAWMFALLMMMLALGFLTKEFVYSQRNPAINIENIPQDELALPVISFCMDHQGVPAFANYPTAQYPGYPLFAVTSIDNEHDETSSLVSYPDSSNSPWSQESFLRGDAEKCKRDLASMSIDRSRQSLFRYNLNKDAAVIGVDKLDENPCQSCFSTGKTKPQVVSSQKARSPSKMPVSTTVSMNRMYSYCVFKNEALYNTEPLQLFQNQFLEHFTALIERGILDIEGGMTQRDRTSTLSFGASTSGPNSLNDMLCSVYFFSGYFYPSEDEGEVSFKWVPEPSVNGILEGSWVSTGSRKYSRIIHKLDEPFVSGPGSESVQKDAYFSRSIEIYFEDATVVTEKNHQVNSNAPAVIVGGPSDSLVYLGRKEQTDGSFEYSAKASSIEEIFTSNGLFTTWKLGFDYREFSTTTVTEQATMSWPEYVTDCFEFVGLFTGVCIFSMIVAPSQALV